MYLPTLLIYLELASSLMIVVHSTVFHVIQADPFQNDAIENGPKN